jgi:hypothetical protein
MGSLALLLAIQLTIMSAHTAAVLVSELIKGDGGRHGGNPENVIESTGRERGQGRNDNEMGLDGNGSSRTANGTVIPVSPGRGIKGPDIGDHHHHYNHYHHHHYYYHHYHHHHYHIQEVKILPNQRRRMWRK